MFNRHYWSFARVPAMIFLFLSTIESLQLYFLPNENIAYNPSFCMKNVSTRIIILQLLACFTGDFMFCHIKNSRLALWLNYCLWMLVILADMIYFSSN